MQPVPKRPSTELDQQHKPKRLRSSFNRLTRNERAQIRILHNRGLPNSKIASIIRRSLSTVVRILSGIVPDDEDQDEDHVDDAFKAMYFPKSCSAVATGNNSNEREGEPVRNGGPLTRNSRAMVRILYSRGVHKTKIARMIGCHPLTVTNIITGTTLIAARDDPTQDYSFVDTTFKAKYPPTSDMKSKTPEIADENKAIQQKEEDLSSTSILRALSPCGSGRTIPRKPLKPASLNVLPPRRLTRQKLQNAQVHPPSAAVHSYHRENTVLEISSSPDIVEEDLEAQVAKFLAGLDIDLSFVHKTLKSQDLGTSDKLFAIVRWPEDKLHDMFKEALPGMTPAQRYTLVMGLKERQEMIEL